ncbi:hypothetical protein LFL96_26675 [Paraburkholderia sp. D15]|uniref:hypothetical protein n=1 Tax=Paraburkholderia sp. D15 TaxID=2880218 RepID=UPI00247985F7|nr:hypothetical protein [Paraburkholderia sp. D15]WGS54597.1 hypothetical protein LFL96_26675 [Paraburkholderia sp. D15]
MKFAYSITRPACLAVTLISFNAIAGAACNKTPVAPQAIQAFGRDMIVNGVPTSLVGVQLAGTVDDVSKAFNAFWTREDVPAKRQPSASGVLLSALDGPCLYVLNLPPQVDGPRTRGILSVVRLGEPRPEHRIPDTVIPLPEQGKVLTDVESRDGGQTGRTWLLDVPGSARWNARRYRDLLMLRGWMDVGHQPDYASVGAHGTAFAMQREGDSLDVSFSDRDGRCVAVVNATRNR